MKQARQLLTFALICLGSFGLTAQSYEASGVGTAIPPGGTGGGAYPETAQFFPIIVSVTGQIGINIGFESLTLDIDHDAPEDLLILLENPDGVRQLVSNGPTGTELDAEQLNFAFAGDQTAGIWQLVVYDAVEENTGTLNRATVTFGDEMVDTIETFQEEVKVAAIAEINVELTDECTAMITPQMVLTGEFDEDDNDFAVPFEAFEVIVMDDDTTNGMILDGCGEFDYKVRAALPSPNSVTSFLDLLPESLGGQGIISVEEVPFGPSAKFDISSPDTLILETSYVAPPANDDVVTLSLTFEETGLLSFSYNTDVAIGTDNANVAVLSFDDEIIYNFPQLMDFPLTDQGEDSGRLSNYLVEAGQTLTIEVQGNDVDLGRGSRVEIFDFVFIRELPIPLEITGFAQVWGKVVAKDEQAPELVSVPDDVFGLICADLDANNLNTLPATVSRCYEVDNDGATIPGSMDPALRAILSPASFDNVDEDVAVVPIFSDNCASVLEVCVSDIVTQTGVGGCGPTIITRTFRANEVGGCAAEYNPTMGTELVTSFTITLDRPTLDQISSEAILPTAEIETCATANAPLEFLPTDEDFPVLTIPSGDTVREFSLNNMANMCAQLNVTVSSSPNPTIVCPNTVKFQRVYSVFDWCEPTSVREFTQFVKIGDSTGPAITGPAATTDANGDEDLTLTYRTNIGDECAALVRLDGPGVSVTDECDGADVSLSVSIYPDGDLTQAPFGAYDVVLNDAGAETSDPLPVGAYSFVYTAVDQCGNISVEQVPFVVVDGSGPTVICEDGVTVSLSRPTGFAVLTPSQVDLGTYDDCSEDITFELGVSDSESVPPTTYDDQLVFDESDANTTRFVTLRVVDELENSNFCVVPVLVELKNEPDCVNDVVRPLVSASTMPSECFPGCSADITLTFAASDECGIVTTDVEIDPNYSPTTGFEPAEVPGASVSIVPTADETGYTVTATNVPAGDHAIRLTVSDAAGNSSFALVPISVCGDDAPSLLCDVGIVAVLIDDGNGGAVAEIWASDLVSSPIFDCFGRQIDKFGIVRFGEGPAVVDQDVLYVSCDDANRDVIVDVYAFGDFADEPEFCTVSVEVQEGNDVDCNTSGGNLIGKIVTDGGAGMGNIAVTLTGTSNMDETNMTNAEGQFNFVNLPLGGDYTLQPNYNEPVNLQQVKISDVVKISTVILGTSTFESPYDYLAADVDQSRGLNVLDMVAIQRVILGLDDMFATNEAWGFIPANVSVNDPYATAFPNVLNANDFQANILDADFVAFAYGNVTGSGRTNTTIVIEDVMLMAGQTHTMIIGADDLAAFQGTFALAAGLELIDASYEGQGALNLNYAAEGLVAAALYGNATLTLEVRATEAGLLSNMVSLTDAVTVREGVLANGNSGTLSLSFGPITEGNLVNALGNATPNPVLEQTQISYTLAADGKVRLSIQDIQGRTVMVRNLEGTQGQNVVKLTTAELRGATGVLTYTMTAGNFSATKKLVVAAR